MQYRYEDGGWRSNAHADEQHDCTVRSLAILADWSYDDTHLLLRRAGRTKGQGFDLVAFLRANPEIADRNFIWVPYRETERIPLVKLIETIEHRAIVCMPGHAATVVNNVLLDQERLDPAAIVWGHITTFD
jgi:hypothetical protein